MIRRIIVFLTISLILSTSIPTIYAENVYLTKENYEHRNQITTNTAAVDSFTNCYVKISGMLSDEDYTKVFNFGPFWKIMFLRLEGNGKPPSFVLYWYIRLDETVQISIKTGENGALLYEHDGLNEIEIRMYPFNGDYISSLTDNQRSYKDISGNVQNIWIKDL